MEKVIEIDKYIDGKETALVGRNNGENLLKRFKDEGILFKNIETEFEKIIIRIPKRIITVNKSFFLGLFETRIIELGKIVFKLKYEFQTSEHIKKKIDGHIDAALLIASQGDILGV